jgi:sortase A
VLTGALVIALAVGGLAVADLLGTNDRIAAAQQRTATRIADGWAATPVPTTAPAMRIPRGAIALLRVPRFGSDYVRVISEGTTDAVLDTGDIGHYIGTAGPGEVGNMALAGHREAHGASLLHITSLRRGDRIIVETRERTYEYRVTGSAQVDPSDVGAIAAVPDHPTATPKESLITLQSCTPPLIDTWRYVVWGRLVSSTPR